MRRYLPRAAVRPRTFLAGLHVVLVAIAGACSGVEATITQPSEERTRPRVTVPRPAVEPTFRARVLRVGPQHIARMGTSWRTGCPVALRDLRVIEMTYRGFDGAAHTGELMVHRRFAKPLVRVFRRLFDARFPIERMELANGYMGDDPPLAQRNNTVGFHCRPPVGGGRTWSEHAYGRAVDINPDLNPYVSPSGRVEPLFGRRHVDRTLTTAGMVHPGGIVVRAFREIGWRWGGSWARTKDYMHFSVTGR